MSRTRTLLACASIALLVVGCEASPQGHSDAIDDFQKVSLRMATGQPVTPQTVKDYCDASERVWKTDTDDPKQARTDHIRRLVEFRQTLNETHDGSHDPVLFQIVNAAIARAGG